ncbi:MAG: hypothetical protein M3O71_04650 [Bacteroidota bacterium]|nr:hypothetical protein [Bacteroidota bacterium]
MELDDFKAHWNNIQQQQLKQQNHTPETLNRIITNTTNTIGYLHEKNVYWNKLGKAICSMLIVVLLINLAIRYFMPEKGINLGESATYVAIMIIYALVTMWVYQRQQNIFTIYNSENVKETLAKTVREFKRFYVLMNLIYLVLYPVYFYAFIKLFMFYWKFPAETVLIICGTATVACLLGSHIYYKIKYFKKIKSLEDDLAELNEI